MSDHLREVVLRRQALVARAAAERGELAVHAAAVRRSLAFADLAFRGYRSLRTRPIGVALVAVALVVIGPGKLLRLGYRSGLLVMGALRILRFIRALRS